MKDVIEGQEFCGAEFETMDIVGAIDTPRDPLANTLEAARDSAADALEGAASTLQEKSGTVSGMSNIAREVGVRLEAAAHYVRRFDAREFVSETKECARKYPAAWLAVSVAVGFAAGWSLRRR